MPKPKKRKKLPKNVSELTGEQVIPKLFGKEGHKALREAALKPSKSKTSSSTEER
jgi:hypothetical protein